MDVSRSATLPISPANFEEAKIGDAVAFEEVKIALRASRERSDAFPPLKMMVGGLLACINIVAVCGRSVSFFQSYRNHRKSGIVMGPVRPNSVVVSMNSSSAQFFMCRLDHCLIVPRSRRGLNAGNIAGPLRVIASLIESFTVRQL